MQGPADTAALYYQLCMAADEFTSFRNSMQVSPAGNSPAMIEAALKRADKVAALLRQLRERQAVSFVTATPAPQPPAQPPAGVQAPQPPPQAPPPQPPPQSQPMGPQYAWKCSACGGQFSTPTAVPPRQCPLCMVELGG